MTETELIQPEEIWRFNSETIKSDIASLAYPFFLVSDKVTHDEPQKVYTDDIGNTITLFPSERGYATINDADILISAMSALMKSKEDGNEISNTLAFYANDYLEYSKKTRGGTTHKIMEDSLFRLLRCSVLTNIKNGKNIYKDGFNFLQNYRIGQIGNKKIVEIVLCDWILDAIETNHVLTLEDDYFSITNPIGKRLYQLFRKYYGLNQRNQPFSFSLDKLKLLIGTDSSDSSFPTMLKRIEKKQNVPGYHFTIKKNVNDKYIVYINRKKEKNSGVKQVNQLLLPNLVNTVDKPLKAFKKAMPHITIFFKKLFEDEFPNEEFKNWRNLYYTELRRTGEQSKGGGEHFLEFVRNTIQIN